jgi:hypothetical protein
MLAVAACSSLYSSDKAVYTNGMILKTGSKRPFRSRILKSVFFCFPDVSPVPPEAPRKFRRKGGCFDVGKKKS